MKSTLLRRVTWTLTSVATLLAASASAPVYASDQPDLLAQIEALAERCVVQPVMTNPAGQKSFNALMSVCPEIRTDARGAILNIDGQTYRAVLVESQDADGGDLDHLIVVDGHGEVVARRQNVPAFGNVLLALTGGRESFRQISYDQR